MTHRIATTSTSASSKAFGPSDRRNLRRLQAGNHGEHEKEKGKDSLSRPRELTIEDDKVSKSRITRSQTSVCP